MIKIKGYLVNGISYVDKSLAEDISKKTNMPITEIEMMLSADRAAGEPERKLDFDSK